MIRRFDTVLYWTGWIVALVTGLLLDEFDRRRYSGYWGRDYRIPKR